jgi:uncharacterized lipoprotein YajG
MNIRILTLTSAVAAIALSGCALTQERITLQYNPQENVVLATGAENISVEVNLIDQRPEKSNKVSVKKNGFGMEMAVISSDEDVPTVIKRIMETELKARGFQINPGSAIVKINTDLGRFYNDFKNGFFAGDAVAELAMSVNVMTKTGYLLYSKHVNAQGIAANIQLNTGNNARIALNDALQKSMKILFEDNTFVNALLTADKPR